MSGWENTNTIQEFFPKLGKPFAPQKFFPAHLLKTKESSLCLWNLRAELLPNFFKVGEKCVPVYLILTAVILSLTWNIHDMQLSNQLVPQISAKQ